MAQAHSYKSIYGILVALSLGGLFAGLYFAHIRMLDPDMVHSVLVWQGIREEGLIWLNDWRFTQDNWLFSLIPFQGLMVQVTGEVLHTLVVSGWLIFFLSAFFSALITRELTGNLAAAIVFTLLVWVNAYGHIEGFVSYPVSHNITNLFGLCTLWQLLRWIKKPSFLYGLGIFSLQLLAGLSDPWLLPTYTLPMILSLAIVSIIFKQKKHVNCGAILGLLSALLVVFVIVKMGAFGVFPFIPAVHFSPGSLSTISVNFLALLGNLGGLFNLIVPLQGQETYWPETRIQHAAFSASILLFLFILSLTRLIHKNQSLSSLIFALVSLFSVLGICSAYVISGVLANATSSRFVINVFYIVTMTIVVHAIQAWPSMNLKNKLGIIFVALLYLVTSMVSIPRFSQLSGYPKGKSAVNELINKLGEHGLNYGYGQYHGSKSNAVTVMTNGRIIVRPITYQVGTGQIRFDHPQTSERWFTPDDAPKEQKRYFVYLTRKTTECPDFDLCQSTLIRDFGEPAEAIDFDDGVIYVWNRPLINSHSLSAQLNQTIYFKSPMNFPHWSGWSIVEPWGVWSDSERAFTSFKFDAPPRGNVRVGILSKAYSPSIGLEQRVDVYANQQKVAEFIYTPNNNEGLRDFVIPKDVMAADSKLSIEFRIGNVFSPKEKKVSDDTRKLGIGLEAITFTTAI